MLVIILDRLVGLEHVILVRTRHLLPSYPTRHCLALFRGAPLAAPPVLIAMRQTSASLPHCRRRCPTRLPASKMPPLLAHQELFPYFGLGRHRQTVIVVGQSSMDPNRVLLHLSRPRGSLTELSWSPLLLTVRLT